MCNKNNREDKEEKKKKKYLTILFFENRNLSMLLSLMNLLDQILLGQVLEV
jgi:hypothetical protein